MAESGFRTKHLKLADMHPTMTSFSTVALIIAKSEPYVFLDKLSSEKRGVINITVRDSKRHIANCKCWGSKSSVLEYNAMLQIGNVVDIVGAKVMAIALPTMLTMVNGKFDHRYQPKGTLACALVVNEGHGYIVKHDINDVDTVQPLRELMHQTHKPMSSALKLADVRGVPTGAEQRSAIFIDLIVVVASLRPVRELKRKVPRNGNELMHCLEVIVIDSSCTEGMVFTLWHADWIRRAQRWQPRKTLLHLIDVRISQSQFYGCPVLNHTSSTLIYENPQPLNAECKELLAFAATAPLKTLEIFAQTDMDNLPTPEQIQTQMTVRQIYARAEGELLDTTSEHFTAVLYAMVTKFDIDGLTKCISKKCKACQRLILSEHTECDNEQCQLEFSLSHNGVRYDNFFNINIQLSDQTGTLIETRLSGDIADRLLGINANAFEQLAERKKTELKWRFLLKYFGIRLLVKKPSAMRKNLAIIVVDMELITLEQLIQKIAVF